MDSFIKIFKYYFLYRESLRCYCGDDLFSFIDVNLL